VLDLLERLRSASIAQDPEQLAALSPQTPFMSSRS
jgi:hypothetical protein